MQKFQGQGLNLHHSCDQSQGSDNAKSLTYCANRELQHTLFMKKFKCKLLHRSGSIITCNTILSITYPFGGTVPGIGFVCDEVQRYSSLVPHVKNLHECKQKNTVDFIFKI